MNAYMKQAFDYGKSLPFVTQTSKIPSDDRIWKTEEKNGRTVHHLMGTNEYYPAEAPWYVAAKILGTTLLTPKILGPTLLTEYFSGLTLIELYYGASLIKNISTVAYHRIAPLVSKEAYVADPSFVEKIELMQAGKNLTVGVTLVANRYFWSVGTIALMGYALINPLMCRVHFNTFEKLWKPENAESMKGKAVSNLNFVGLFASFRKDGIGFGDLLGITPVFVEGSGKKEE